MQQRIIHPVTDFELSLDRTQMSVFTAAAAITAGDSVFVNSSGRIDRAQANASSTMHAIGVAFEGIASGGAGRVVTHGPMRSDNYDSSGYLGLNAYVSPTTAGGVSATPPASSGQIVQQIGVWRERGLLFVSLGGAFQRGGTL